jgi:putative two-component system response regulator
VAIENEERAQLGTSADVNAYKTSSQRNHQKVFKILLMSENSSDIFMIKKMLPKNDGYKIYEVSTLSRALKVLNYLSIDLMLIDDMLSNVDGYECVYKLNQLDVAKEIPKIIFLTQDYKTEKKESVQDDNLDFVKKPFDAVIFKLRVKSMLKSSTDKIDRKSYFKQLSNDAFLEAHAYMGIYQEIFESSEKMMCIYDAQQGEIVEANAIFEQFFINVNAFNRIVSHDRIARKFVPLMDEANYLNYYAPSEWMQTLIDGMGFTYLVKLKRDYKEYSFNISVQKMHLANRTLYLIKLFNIYDYLPQNPREKSATKLPLKEQNLGVFKDDFLHLREQFKRLKTDNKDIETLLYQMSSKLSIVCDDVSIVQDYNQQKEINVYFILVSLLKDRFMDKNIYINNHKVDKFLEENEQEIYLPLDANAIHDVIFGILNNYYGNTFNTTTTYKRLDVTVHRDEALHITLKMDKSADASGNTLVGKWFSKLQDSQEEAMLPKNVKTALSILQGDIEKIEEKGQILFNIKIPL